jgi:type II secretory pathway component PulF
MYTLSALLAGGVVLTESLLICREGTGNRVFGRFLDSVLESVREGKGLALPISRTEFLPDLVKQMIRTGEETGNLPVVMNRIADYYEDELEQRVKRLSSLLEPTLLLVMGAVVGLVVISLILPIFKLTRSIH